MFNSKREEYFVCVICPTITIKLQDANEPLSLSLFVRMIIIEGNSPRTTVHSSASLSPAEWQLP